MVFGGVGRWLVALADARGAPDRLPTRGLSLGKWGRLFDLAERHFVLPVVLRNARHVRAAGAALVGDASRARWDQLVAKVQDRLHTAGGLALLVRSQLAQLAGALAPPGIEAMLLKGADFADRLYPRPDLRLFGDVDLLVPRRAEGDVAAVLTGLGYRLAPEEGKRHETGYGEVTWYRPDRPGASVEVHWNLVNSPMLQRGVSVTFEDLSPGEACRALPHLRVPSPAGLLVLACVHAATGHEFDRLRMLCDVQQAGREGAGAIDAEELAALLDRTGAGRAVAAALDATRRVLGEPRAHDWQVRLGLRCPWWVRLAVSRGVILRAHAWRDSFRRKILRQWLKRR